MNKQTCLESGKKLGQMIEAWRGTNDIKNLENIVGLCDAIRRSSLSVPECREVYLQAVQFVLEATSAGSAEQLTAILKLQQTASRMLRGDDVATLPAGERATYRSEVMTKHALFAKRLSQEVASARQAGPFYINVAPPTNLGQPGFAGMNPETIKDPVKRQEYVEAIKANASKKDASKRATRLSAVLGDEQRQIERYVLRNYPATPDAKKEVQQFLELGGFEKQQVQSVMKKISVKGNATDQ